MPRHGAHLLRMWNRLDYHVSETANSGGPRIALGQRMLKFLGAYALAKVLGFGLFTAVLIYMLIR